MKKFCLVLLFCLIVSVFPFQNAVAGGDSSSDKEAGIGLMAGFVYAVFVPVILSYCTPEWYLSDLSFGGRDMGSGIGYYPKVVSYDDNDQKETLSSNGFIVPTAVTMEWKSKWLGFITPGWEIYADMSFAYGEASRTEDNETEKTIQVFDFNAGTGPNFTFLEIPDLLRIRCGTGYLFSFSKLTTLYIHPTIDIKVAGPFTLNANLFQSYYGAPIDGKRTGWTFFEIGGSYVFSMNDTLHRISLGLFHNKTTKSGNNSGWTAQGVMLSYSHPFGG